MAQIIKHRRGSISTLKNTTARNGELIIATGSISDLSGPFIFIGSPVGTDEGVAGAFNAVSKLYQGATAPTISAGTYGSGLDGLPFYASSENKLYILNNSNVGNTTLNLVGNIEGNTISGVTITNLTGTTATIESQLNVSGSLNLTGSLYINGTSYTAASSGTSGSNGTDGTSGSNGTDGSSGTSGSNGTDGSSGSNGTDGSSGTSGSNGTDGTSGSSGSNGTDGTSGSNGTDGSSGSNGTDGTSGSNGTDGSSGTSGDSLFAETTPGTWTTTNDVEITGSLTVENGTISGSFTGDGAGLYNIPASGVTGLELNKIVSGSVSASIQSDGTFRVNGDTYIDGILTAKELHIDYVTSSVLYTSGSTKFGDTLDDTHEFTGSVYITGSVLEISGGDLIINGTSYTAATSGTSGSNGTDGSSGSSGSNGTDGTSGSNGTDGTSGSNGTDGTSGSNGTDGSSGSNGTDGSSGTSGSNGTDGSSGSSGSSGSNGTDGSSGTSGSNGTDGSSGSNGTDGTSGSNGTDGSSGSNGTDGTSGSNGTDGTSGTSVSVTGTNNYIGKFDSTGATITLVDSSITDDGTVVTINSDVNIEGILTAREIHMDYVTSSVLYTSGSNKFGNTLDDTHEFTGSVNITGSISLNGQAIGTGKLDETWFNNYVSGSESQFAGTSSYATSASYAENAVIVSGQTKTLNVTSASTTWSFNHNLGYKYPAINVFDNSDKVVIPTEIEVIDSNNLKVYFNEAQTGTVIATVGGNGSSGSSGTDGSSGTSGSNGTDGSSGSSGSNGTDGTSGSNGTDGSSGTSGSNGTDGSSGSSGSNGTDGTSGSNGTDGSSGSSGSNGTDGSSGSNGTDGSSGSSGSNGTDGSSGSNGTDGSSGTSGDSLFAETTPGTWTTTNNVEITGSLTVETGDISGSFIGDGAGLYNIPASGVTGLELNKIVSGSVSASVQADGTFRVNGDTYIDGILTAKELHIDYVTSSVLYTSGSTKFGDTNDDIHQFTGSLNILSGSVNITEGDLTINGVSFLAMTSGTSGSNGTDGSSGSSGSNGTDGSSGTSGSNGTDGTSGSNGTDGSSGSSGTSGSNGTDGSSGSNGTDGSSGSSGSSGSNGTDGTSGSNGTDGSSGTSGVDGASGTSGSDGTDGSSGTSGSNGTDGSSGSNGTDGSSGTSGSNGTDGTSGSNGTDGSSGTSGSNGTDGTSGTSVSVTGTNNYIGKFDSTGATITLVDSNMVDDGTKVTVNTDLSVTGNTIITGSLTVASGSATMLGGDLYVSGNLQILGSSTNVNLQSNTVEIGDNIILVNAYSPFQRYAGISAFDSGSIGFSGSILWDSETDTWLTNGSRLNKIVGVQGNNSGGTNSLTQWYFPRATSDGYNVENGMLRETNTGNLVFGDTGEKFIVNSTSGDIITTGSLTFRGDYGLGFDSGSLNAQVTFRDDVSKKVGLVSNTTSSFAVGSMLGYKESDGTLIFTDTIDGGTF